MDKPLCVLLVAPSDRENCVDVKLGRMGGFRFFGSYVACAVLFAGIADAILVDSRNGT